VPGLADTEGDPDQVRTPGGVLATQGQGCFTDRVGVGLRQSPGQVVVGAHRRLAAPAEPPQQVADGADGEAELDGELDRGPSLLGQLKELSPHGDRDRLGHGEWLLAEGATEPMMTIPLNHGDSLAAKPHVRNNSAKPTGR